jgi:HEPN domain-containing protein
MSTSYKLPEEWFKQADYDLGTAKSMLRSRRYIYTVFMCHLAIEKALKGIFAKKFRENPSKTHNLNYLFEEINLEIPEKFQDFIDNLNNLSVPTRYPDKLERLLQDFKKGVTKKTYNQTKELLQWLKKVEL